MTIVTTLDTLIEQVDYFKQQDAFVFDVETLPIDPTHSGHRGDPRRNRVAWISFATVGRTFVLPLGHPNGEYLRTEYPLTAKGEEVEARRRAAGKMVPLASSYSTSEKLARKVFGPPPEQLRWSDDVRDVLRPLMFSEDITKIGHNIKFDLLSLAKHFGGELMPGPYVDTKVVGFLLDVRNKGFLSLDQCVKREIEYTMVKGVGKEIESHTFDEVAKYAFIDAKYDWLLYKEYVQQVESTGLQGLFRLEMDVLEVVANMEHVGVPVDVEVLRRLDVEFRAELQRLETEIYRTLGRPLNINSNQELSRALFTSKKEGGRGLKPKMLTEGGKKKKQAGEELTFKDYSTSEDALKAHLGDPFVDLVVEHANMQKLVSAFIVPYIGGEVTKTSGDKTTVEVRESMLVNGRIHATFNQDGAETGRFSSKNPNLQQVPSRSEVGKQIRSAVVALPGWKLVQADYSQIEPRILADLSGDETLIRVYLDGGDIYTTLADPFGLDRAAGKVLFLSVAYSTGPDTLSRACNLPLKDAKNIIYDEFPKAFPLIERLRKKTYSEAKRRKGCYVQTMLGRRRYLPDLRSTNDSSRRRAERQAFNCLIQGNAADINKVGLVKAFYSVPTEAEMILTVHDEVVIHVPKSFAEETASALTESMTSVKLLNRVPLIADAKIVDNWGQCKD